MADTTELAPAAAEERIESVLAVRVGLGFHQMSMSDLVYDLTRIEVAQDEDKPHVLGVYARVALRKIEKAQAVLAEAERAVRAAAAEAGVVLESEG